jgi:uncharacterized protein (DUF2236 family)
MAAQSLVDRLPFVGMARAHLDEAARRLMDPPPGMPRVDYRSPAGDPGIAGPDSLAWRIVASPGALFIGGVSAVFLELAEPRVRSGVWDHTQFRVDPIGRIRRTGIAAMITTYASTADVEALTSRVRAMHDRVTGVTPEGVPYRANDPELITWVHVTAVYGFLQAYLRFVDPSVSLEEQDRYYRQSIIAARQYGAEWAPSSVAEVEDYFESVRPRLVDHPIVHEYFSLVWNAPALSKPALPLQRLLVEAAVDILPPWARRILDLEKGQWARVAARPLVQAAVALLGRLRPAGPPEEACARVGVSPAILRV